ncbi:MAG: casein kinase II, regulatory subunit [Olpidium bornovanus]|uniref:Casein kinase II subunit beta n=1 Tax=Olpidium bornovanus TaxID=278681 RepID=A0A8H8DFK2_9FUNG|nr:MAG: casein kinase II, regulatory subunit [Olpidium bornovanus]
MILPRNITIQMQKYREGHFGYCPRVFCEQTSLLPVGLSDVHGVDHVKLFCPSCLDIYNPPHSRYSQVDGGLHRGWQRHALVTFFKAYVIVQMLPHLLPTVRSVLRDDLCPPFPRAVPGGCESISDRPIGDLPAENLWVRRIREGAIGSPDAVAPVATPDRRRCRVYRQPTGREETTSCRGAGAGGRGRERRGRRCPPRQNGWLRTRTRGCGWRMSMGKREGVGQQQKSTYERIKMPFSHVLFGFFWL